MMLKLLHVLVGLASFIVTLSTASPLTSSVKIDTGIVQGNQRDQYGILSFKGIPFAAPPVGDKRWKSPKSAPLLNGTFDAIAYGYTCYNAIPSGSISTLTKQSEDCLSVNIWTGARERDDKRPVMVWIYGGGFEFGGSASNQYNGTRLAQEYVVVVSFNYRLGVLGFLALPELDAEGTMSGNFGLQDQIAALKWVKKNIGAFGGDPDNITIFGESAGSHSVGFLMASTLTEGLFHKAIMESGAYWESEHGSLETFSQARAKGKRFQEKMGAASIEALRAISAAEVNNATLWTMVSDPGVQAFAPNVDKYVVTAPPSQIFDSGKTRQIPLLGGFNSGEQLLFLTRVLPHDNATEFYASAEVLFQNRTDEFTKTYHAGPSQARINSSAEILVGDLIISQQTWEALDRQALKSRQDVFAYNFDYKSAYSPLAAHSSEINVVFGNLGQDQVSHGQPSAQDEEFSSVMRKYWTNFAKSGDPNGAGLPSWPRYAGQANDFLVLANSITSIDTPGKSRFKFIRSLRRNGILPKSWRGDFVDN